MGLLRKPFGGKLMSAGRNVQYGYGKKSHLVQLSLSSPGWYCCLGIRSWAVVPFFFSRPSSPHACVVSSGFSGFLHSPRLWVWACMMPWRPIQDAFPSHVYAPALRRLSWGWSSSSRWMNEWVFFTNKTLLAVKCHERHLAEEKAQGLLRLRIVAVAWVLACSILPSCIITSQGIDPC